MFNHRKTPSKHRGRRAVASAIVATVIVGGSTVLTAAPANAVISNGVMIDGPNGPIGTFYDNTAGVYVICIDRSLSAPNGQSWDASTVTTVGSLPANPANVNSVDVNDPTQMAFLNYFTAQANINPALGPAADLAALTIVTGLPIDRVEQIYSPGGQVNADAEALLAQANSIPIANGTSSTGGSADISISIDTANNYKGVLTVNNVQPANATATITLTNGKFADNGATTISGVANGATLNIIGVPPTFDGAPYKISYAASFTGTGSGGGWLPQVQVANFNGSGQQRVIGPAGQQAATPAQFNLNGIDPSPRAVTFQPVVSSQTQAKYYKKGDKPVDILTFATAPDANGLNNPWPQDATSGDYLDIKASDVLYGPVEALPDSPLTEVPAGTPIAARVTVSTGKNGPTARIEAKPDTGIPTSGYYVWVEGIPEDQSALAKRFLPDAYSYTAPYGQPSETFIALPEVKTTATPLQVAGFPIADTADVSGIVTKEMGLSIGWKAFPGTFTIAPDGTVTQTGTPVCTGDPIFTSPLQAITGPGKYTSEKYTPATPMVVNWQEYLEDSQGEIVSKGECGAEGETSIVQQLEITTQTSSATAQVGDRLYDNTIIRGTIPEGAQIQWVFKHQNGTTASADDPVIWTSAMVGLTPGVVNGVVYRSPKTDPLPVDAIGMNYFQETVFDKDGKPIEQGKPGVASESTAVFAFSAGAASIGSGLASTGSDNLPQLWAGSAFAIAAMAAGLSLVLKRRTRRMGHALQGSST